MQTTVFECKGCGGWSKQPAGYKETKHFARCVCGQAMYKSPPIDLSSAIGQMVYPAKKEVEAGLMEHGEK